jgi:predicted DCC family thiol-disulfide oxidoreductase YuxK
MIREHIIFYDAECPFCNFWVEKLLRIDTQKIFVFASLEGKTAKRELQRTTTRETVVLLQDYGSSDEKEVTEGIAILRIFWLLGGSWSFLGWLSFLPGILFNWAYRLIAKNRCRLFTSCKIGGVPRDRFLE